MVCYGKYQQDQIHQTTKGERKHTTYHSMRQEGSAALGTWLQKKKAPRHSALAWALSHCI
jgi:hypothetical protein